MLVQTVDGIVEFLSGRLNPARVKLREVIKTLEAESLGTRFALTNAQLFLVVAQVHLGQWSEFLELMPRLFEEATRRGDTFALTQFRVNQCNVYWLAQDAADAAADAVTQAAEQWSPRGFQTVHYYQMLARAQIALYQGNGSKAYELVRTAWPHMKRNFLLRAQMLRSEALHLRGRAAWAAGDVADAERCRKLLEKEDNPFARGLAAATRMMMGGTPAQLDHAEKQLEGAELLALLHAARCRRFAGTDQERFALHWFSDHGVRKPEAMVDMLVPRNQVLRTVAR